MGFVQNLRAVPLNYKYSYLSTFPEFFLVLAVFTKELGSSRIMGIDFDWIGYPFFIFYFVLRLRDILLSNSFPWKLFLLLVGGTFISIFVLGIGWGGFLKQIFSIIIIYSVNFFIISKYDWRILFKLYVKLAYFSAIFGIIQWILSVNGIQVLIKIPGRLDSISFETSHYAYNFVAALILTFNLTGYLVFLIIISIAFVSPVYFIVSIPILYFIVFNVFVDFNENFNKRIVDTIAVFKGEVEILNGSIAANGTTVSLYSNLMVAFENIKNNLLTGAGLGGHEETYYRLYSKSSFRFNWHYGLNANSAHSLTIRILSEFGLLGFALYVITLIRNIFLLDKGMFRAISLACLSHFLCKTFKLAGYIDYGTPFFFAMLIINGIQYRYNKTLYGAK
jgi:hypothetical protein